MITVFCDGVFDLFHYGHLNHLKQIKKYFKEPVYLIVGVIDDNTSAIYKRRPIFNENMRKKIISSCKYTDSVLLMNNLIITEEFIKEHNIDFIVHAFSNKEDHKNQNEFYTIPIQLNKFIVLDYTTTVSTTNILKDNNMNWSDIWEKKGLSDTDDLYLLNGYEETNFEPKLLIERVISILNINLNDTIVEIGCGSGLLSQYLTNYEYLGVDKSLSLVNKHIKLLHNAVLNFSSSESIFKDNYFKYCICNSMLEYMNDMDELNGTIDEMERITSNGIFIGNIRYKTRTEKCNKHKINGVFTHFIIDKTYFINRGYTIIDNLFEPLERYDVYKFFA
tara:strand:- start:3089 stop:4090 length:1002 start_codon:yes stop_codon:yes gene_type:complete